MKINEVSAKLIALAFFSRENEAGGVARAVLEGNSWVVSVNIEGSNIHTKKVLVDAESGRVLCYYKSDPNPAVFP